MPRRCAERPEPTGVLGRDEHGRLERPDQTRAARRRPRRWGWPRASAPRLPPAGARTASLRLGHGCMVAGARRDERRPHQRNPGPPRPVRGIAPSGRSYDGPVTTSPPPSIRRPSSRPPSRCERRRTPLGRDQDGRADPAGQPSDLGRDPGRPAGHRGRCARLADRAAGDGHRGGDPVPRPRQSARHSASTRSTTPRTPTRSGTPATSRTGRRTPTPASCRDRPVLVHERCRVRGAPATRQVGHRDRRAAVRDERVRLAVHVRGGRLPLGAGPRQDGPPADPVRRPGRAGRTVPRGRRPRDRDEPIRPAGHAAGVLDALRRRGAPLRSRLVPRPARACDRPRHRPGAKAPARGCGGAPGASSPVSPSPARSPPSGTGSSPSRCSCWCRWPGTTAPGRPPVAINVAWTWFRSDAIPAFLTTVPVALVLYVCSWIGWIVKPGGYLRDWGDVGSRPGR